MLGWEEEDEEQAGGSELGAQPHSAASLGLGRPHLGPPGGSKSLGLGKVLVWFPDLYEVPRCCLLSPLKESVGSVSSICSAS